MERAKQEVLIFQGCYLPGSKAGGSLRSVCNLVNALGDHFAFRIVTQDRDLGDSVPYEGVTPNQWVRVGKAEVMYVQPGWTGLRTIWRILRGLPRGSVLYINSFFSRQFSMLPMFIRRLGLCHPGCVVLAPRGELSPGAMGLKAAQKNFYISMSRRLRIYDEMLWHASTNIEADHIRSYFRTDGAVDNSADGSKSSFVCVASDFASERPAALSPARKAPGTLRVIFVSRISPIKNLTGALTVLASLNGEITFDIFGPVEDSEYWQECMGIVARMPSNIRVTYRGEIKHDQVVRTFSDYHLFLFPTLGENFGHVIAEALSAGCPVLTSDQTPWTDLESEGGGWLVPVSNIEHYRSIVMDLLEYDDLRYEALSTNAMTYGSGILSDARIVDANQNLFESALKIAAARSARDE